MAGQLQLLAASVPDMRPRHRLHRLQLAALWQCTAARARKQLHHGSADRRRGCRGCVRGERRRAGGGGRHRRRRPRARGSDSWLREHAGRPHGSEHCGEPGCRLDMLKGSTHHGARTTCSQQHGNKAYCAFGVTWSIRTSTARAATRAAVLYNARDHCTEHDTEKYTDHACVGLRVLRDHCTVCEARKLS
jgi:hypothetical protein